MTKCNKKKRTLAEEIAGINELLSFVDVDINKGSIVWNTDLTSRARKGIEAGSDDNGYRTIRFNKKKYFRHRIIYYVATGELPEMIDHRYGKIKGDSIDNLRECNYTQNNINVVRSGGVIGFRGVYSCKKKWRARIGIDGVMQHIGTFSNPVDAAKAYDVKAREVYGEFAILNFGDIDANN